MPFASCKTTLWHMVRFQLSCSAQAFLFLGFLRDTSDTPKLQKTLYYIISRLLVSVVGFLDFCKIPFSRGHKIVIPRLPVAATPSCSGSRAAVLLYNNCLEVISCFSLRLRKNCSGLVSCFLVLLSVDLYHLPLKNYTCVACFRS